MGRKEIRFQKVTNKKVYTKKPHVVTQQSPEKNHFTNNYKNTKRSPLIALIGDSTLKNLSGYQLGRNCEGAKIMVRSQRGGKVKNIKNLMIDLIEDVKPDAICFHVGTNDINSRKSTLEIRKEIEYLIKLTQRQGILPVLSLITKRTDKYGGKVDELNQVIVDLCNRHGVGYIEHANIQACHLNESGLHIDVKHTHLFSANFANYFNSLVNNDFILL